MVGRVDFIVLLRHIPVYVQYRLFRGKLCNTAGYYMANWSTMKRSILIGSLSGPNFAIRTAKMDCSRTHFAEFLLRNIEQKKYFLFPRGTTSFSVFDCKVFLRSLNKVNIILCYY